MRSTFGRRTFVAGLVGIVACNQDRLVTTADLRPNLAMSSMTCQTTFTVVVTEQDSLMTQYGLPWQTDTADYCASWTGSDYSLQVKMRGTSETATAGVQDQVQSIEYAVGNITPYGYDGAQVQPTSYVAATAFDLVNADDNLRQASYDDPWYGVMSDPEPSPHDPPPSGGCADPTQLVCDPGSGSMSSKTPTAINAQLSALDTTKFRRHGLRRRGIRALVDGKVEIARGASASAGSGVSAIASRKLRRSTQVLNCSSRKRHAPTTTSLMRVTRGGVLAATDGCGKARKSKRLRSSTDVD